METARVARFCAEHDIPFASVRAVSDDVQTALSPRLVALLSGGRVSPLRLLGNVARQPRLVAELWRLARQTRLASAQLALALGEGGEQTAPLGRAVIGGLVAATLTTLLVVPSIFAVVQARAGTRSVSLDPDDPESPYHDQRGQGATGPGETSPPAATQPTPA